MNCKFCDFYNELKEYNKGTLKEFKEKGKPIRRTYKVSLVEKTTRIGWGVPDAGTHTYKPMKLNYCPMCGRKLK